MRQMLARWTTRLTLFLSAVLPAVMAATTGHADVIGIWKDASLFVDGHKLTPPIQLATRGYKVTVASLSDPSRSELVVYDLTPSKPIALAPEPGTPYEAIANLNKYVIIKRSQNFTSEAIADSLATWLPAQPQVKSISRSHLTFSIRFNDGMRFMYAVSATPPAQPPLDKGVQELAASLKRELDSGSLVAIGVTYRFISPPVRQDEIIKEIIHVQTNHNQSAPSLPTGFVTDLAKPRPLSEREQYRARK